jgi:hypothetical protein
MLKVTVALALAGCGGQDAQSCSSLCSVLVETCTVAAYPDTTTCVEGCLADQDQGADIDRELECVQTTNCDLFQIVECEHTFGVE